MSIPETQKDVLAYLDGITREIDRSRLDRFTTASIASALAVSRNLASQYLNDLVRADLAVKAGSKPVYYFHRRDLERYMQVGLDRSTFSSVDSLFSQSKPAAPDFERAIGSELSLSACIDQIRAAMVYPPCGIPVLLLGQYGTGKSLFAELARVSCGIANEIMRGSFEPIELSAPAVSVFHQDIDYDNTVYWPSYREKVAEAQAVLDDPEASFDAKKLARTEVTRLTERQQIERIAFPIDMRTYDFGSVVFVTFPGELGSTLGMRIKAMFPGKVAIVIGYANDGQGYFVPAGDFGLGYESFVTKLPEGGIENVLDAFGGQV